MARSGKGWGALRSLSVPLPLATTIKESPLYKMYQSMPSLLIAVHVHPLPSRLLWLPGLPGLTGY